MTSDIPPPDWTTVADTGQRAIPGPMERAVMALERMATGSSAESNARLAKLEELATSAKTTVRVLMALGGIATAIALALATWVWAINQDVILTEAAVARVKEDLSGHMQQGGPMGHPASVIERTTRNEGRILTLEQRADRRDAALVAINTKLEQILERLPRR